MTVRIHVGICKDLSFVLCPYLDNGGCLIHQKVFEVMKYVEIRGQSGPQKQTVAWVCNYAISVGLMTCFKQGALQSVQETYRGSVYQL